MLVGCPAPPEDDHVALVGRREAFAYLYRRRLAGAIRTEQPEALAPSDLEIETVDRYDVIVSLSKSMNRYGERVAHGVTRVP